MTRTDEWLCLSKCASNIFFISTSLHLLEHSAGVVSEARACQISILPGAVLVLLKYTSHNIAVQQQKNRLSLSPAQIRRKVPLPCRVLSAVFLRDSCIAGLLCGSAAEDKARHSNGLLMMMIRFQLESQVTIEMLPNTNNWYDNIYGIPNMASDCCGEEVLKPNWVPQRGE